MPNMESLWVKTWRQKFKSVCFGDIQIVLGFRFKTKPRPASNWISKVKFIAWFCLPRLPSVGFSIHYITTISLKYYLYWFLVAEKLSSTVLLWCQISLSGTVSDPVLLRPRCSWNAGRCSLRWRIYKHQPLLRLNWNTVKQMHCFHATNCTVSKWFLAMKSRRKKPGVTALSSHFDLAQTVEKHMHDDRLAFSNLWLHSGQKLTWITQQNHPNLLHLLIQDPRSSTLKVLLHIRGFKNLPNSPRLSFLAWIWTLCSRVSLVHAGNLTVTNFLSLCSLRWCYMTTNFNIMWKHWFWRTP